MLLHLPKAAIDRVLELTNISWYQMEVLSVWRKSEIIPAAKKDKPTDAMESYRPIALTSCPGSLSNDSSRIDCTIFFERTNQIHPNQSGFRSGRSTQDQIMRLIQEVSDAFESKEKRMAAVFIDFRRAFDKVWRNGLYSKMVDMGLPACMIRWCKALCFSLFSDRQARVRFDGTPGRFRCFRDGLPQGTVLSPLLFDIFINEECHDNNQHKLEPPADSAGRCDVAPH